MRHNKFLTKTNSYECAQEILNKKEIFEREVEHCLVNENITARFLIFQIDNEITLEEIQEETAEENGLIIQNAKDS